MSSYVHARRPDNCKTGHFTSWKEREPQKSVQKCTCKACNTIVFHCQRCKFMRFLLPSLSWLITLRNIQFKQSQQCHKFAYLTMKKKMLQFARFALSFFIFPFYSRNSSYQRREMTYFSVVWTTEALDGKVSGLLISKPLKQIKVLNNENTFYIL